jgi:hypothetical protein
MGKRNPNPNLNPDTLQSQEGENQREEERSDFGSRECRST